LPAALALIVLAWPIIHVLFEHGAFGPEDSLKTSWALAAYAAGLPAYVLIKVLAPGFFAREDTRTPVKVALLCLGANLIFVVTLMWPLAHVGIALATALSAWMNAGLLAWLLRRDGLLQPDTRLRRRLTRIAAAALTMAAGLWLLQALLAPLRPSLSLALLVVAGGGGFLALARLFGALDLRELKRATLAGR
jgi:putative peptidoglycan lipid II flippase